MKNDDAMVQRPDFRFKVKVEFCRYVGRRRDLQFVLVSAQSINGEFARLEVLPLEEFRLIRDVFDDDRELRYHCAINGNHYATDSACRPCVGGGYLTAEQNE